MWPECMVPQVFFTFVTMMVILSLRKWDRRLNDTLYVDSFNDCLDEADKIKMPDSARLVEGYEDSIQKALVVCIITFVLAILPGLKIMLSSVFGINLDCPSLDTLQRNFINDLHDFIQIYRKYN